MSSYDGHNKVSRKFKVLDGFPTTLIAFVKHTLYYPYNKFQSAFETVSIIPINNQRIGIIWRKKPFENTLLLLPSPNCTTLSDYQALWVVALIDKGVQHKLNQENKSVLLKISRPRQLRTIHSMI